MRGWRFFFQLKSGNSFRVVREVKFWPIFATTKETLYLEYCRSTHGIKKHAICSVETSEYSSAFLSPFSLGVGGRELLDPATDQVEILTELVKDGIRASM